ncbi:hypothetical protein K3495_g10691 [Podosphaera aphanis]|nr:hypothetical protein K3495_g10691 [Podosphaera aphanis]
MGFSLPAYSYPQAHPDNGYWGPVTSTINWCEEDYYATVYSAEIVNTITNILFMVLGLKGLRNCIQYKHDGVFAVAFLGYLFVGIGSFAFHTTLKYSMQLVDELSMIYTTCLMCYATFSFARSQLFRQLLGFGLLSLSIFITLCYHYLQNPVFHQNAFAVLIAVVLLRSMYTMEFKIRRSLKLKPANSSSEKTINIMKSQVSSGVRRDMNVIDEMWLMVALGLSIFLGGFGMWNLDNMYCSTLRSWRHQLGLPWGLLLEGHGWWHLMTGLGSYYYLTWGVWLRYCLSEQQDKFVLYWPSIFFSLPEVMPLSKAEEFAAAKNRKSKKRHHIKEVSESKIAMKVL